MTHQNRLWIAVEPPSDMDEILINKINVMKDFATAISGYYCEICGQSVKENISNVKVKCAVCKFRDD